MHAAFQSFIATQPTNGGANERPNSLRQTAPHITITNTQMPLVAAKQFVGPLTDQRHFNILAGALRNKVHRNDGGSRDRFFEAFDDFRKGPFEFALIKSHCYMLCAQERRSLCRVMYLVIGVTIAVTYRVRWPGAALFVHQSQKQSRVQAAAKQYSDRHVTQEMPSNCRPIQFQKFTCGVFIFLRT